MRNQLRQAVSAATASAPAERSTLAHCRAVAPEVNTSSTSTTFRRANGRPSLTSKAPSTFPSRDVTRGSPCGSVDRVRRNAPRPERQPSRSPSSRAIQAAWSKPRSRARWRCNGTGTTQARAQAGPTWARQASAIARTSHRPAAALASSLNRRTKAPPVPAYRHGATRWARFRSASWSCPHDAPNSSTASPHRMHPGTGRRTRFWSQEQHSPPGPTSPHAAQTGGRARSTAARENSRHERRREPHPRDQAMPWWRRGGVSRPPSAHSDRTRCGPQRPGSAMRRARSACAAGRGGAVTPSACRTWCT